MERSEILAGVIECLKKVLDVHGEEIQESSKLIDDLGADSLDLLDLTFHLEQQFKIKLSVQHLQRQVKEEMGDIPLEIDGVYTPEGLERIRRAMPEINPDELPNDLTVAELPRRFRVATMVNLVTRTLEGSNDKIDSNNRR